MESLLGKKVTVIGLGRFGGGVGVTRWLCSQGAIVTVSDKAPAEELAESIAALRGSDVRLHLGSHKKEDFLQADLLVVNPAVPKDLPLLRKAIAAGVPRTTEINLFLQRCPAPVVGVTGSVGKSTTTAMIGEILRRRFTTHVGGNIGRSLLEELPNIRPDHVVVLELSSFQLEDLPIIGISPHVAVVTNLLPNHLDRHKTMRAYAAAKKNIYRFQTRHDVLILTADCPRVSKWANIGKVTYFCAQPRPSGRKKIGDCPYFPGTVTYFSPRPRPSGGRKIGDCRYFHFELKVPGEHNQADAQAAWAGARQFGIDRATAAAALRDFTGLPHRLQFVTQRDGVRYYNDSKCTTPEGGIVALKAFEPRKIVIIVGGSDKHVSFSKFGSALARRAKAVIGIGQTRKKILRAVEAARRGKAPVVQEARDLASAIALAKQQAVTGDVVLLSPACASYGMFRNYEQRGELFMKLVRGS